MKKALMITIALILASGLAFAGFDWSSVDYEAYGGLDIGCFQAEGLKNIEGLREDLEDLNGSKLGYGFALGVKGNIQENVKVLVDVSAELVNLDSYSIFANVGIGYYPIDKKAHLGLGLKAGYFNFTNNLIEVPFDYWFLDANGKHVTGEAGDFISYNVMGLSINPVLDFSYDVNKIFSLGATVGYRFGISFGESSLQLNGHDLPKWFRSINEIDVDMDPVISVNGVTAQLYVGYKF